MSDHQTGIMAERQRTRESSPASAEKARNVLNRLRPVLKCAGMLGLAGLGVGGVGDLLGLWNLPGFSVTALGGLLTRIPGLNADLAANITRTAGEVSQSAQRVGESFGTTIASTGEQLRNFALGETGVPSVSDLPDGPKGQEFYSNPDSGTHS